MKTERVALSLLLFFSALIAAELAFRFTGLPDRLVAENLYMHKAHSYAGADLVIMGDSRILHGFDTLTARKLLELKVAPGEETFTVFNAGLSGAPPMTQLAWVRRILSQEKKPRIVLLGISPYMFSSKIVKSLSRESLHTLWRTRDLWTAVRAGAGLEELSLIAANDLFQLFRFRPRLKQLWIERAPLQPPEQLGEAGWVAFGPVPPWVQEQRGTGRGMAYRTEMWKPDAHFGNEQMGYFTEALRQLKAAGIRTLVVNTPSASQIDLAYGPQSIYDEHVAWVKAQAEEQGATWVPGTKNAPGVADSDFVDGDHLANVGAAKFTAHLVEQHVIPALGGRRDSLPPGCRRLFDFDHPEALSNGWTLQGTAFHSPIATGPRPGQSYVFGQLGSGFLSTYAETSGDQATGEATSPTFEIDQDVVVLRVAGGSSALTRVSLLVGDSEIVTVRGKDSEIFEEARVNVSAHRGKSAVLRIQDSSASGWGHLAVDEVALCPL